MLLVLIAWSLVDQDCGGILLDKVASMAAADKWFETAIVYCLLL